MFAKDVGEFGGSGHGGHLIFGTGHQPLAACVVVLNPRRLAAQQDHAVRALKQLLWGEEQVNQGRAATAQPK